MELRTRHSHQLGIRISDEARQCRDTEPLPYRSEPFRVTTTQDNQPAIRVEVWQGPRGARRVGGECVLLGELEMEVAPAPAGRPCFEVLFEVREDSTGRVEVRDPASRAAPRQVALTGASVALGPEPAPRG